MKAIGLALAALVFFISPGEAAEPLNPIEITEWPVSHGGRSRDPFAESPTSVWFVGQANHYLARLDVATGKIEHIPLKDDPGPHNVIVGRDGMVWYSGNLDGYIGRAKVGN